MFCNDRCYSGTCLASWGNFQPPYFIAACSHKQVLAHDIIGTWGVLVDDPLLHAASDKPSLCRPCACGAEASRGVASANLFSYCVLSFGFSPYQWTDKHALAKKSLLDIVVGSSYPDNSSMPGAWSGTFAHRPELINQKCTLFLLLCAVQFQ